MLIIPAIDLLDGKAVRLYQGDYAKKQVFGDQPVEYAKRFRHDGAKHLHLVDLDGAKVGHPCHLDVLCTIKKQIHDLHIEVGGGIRCAQDVRHCFESGADEVILGTSVLRDPDFCAEMISTYRDKIVMGIDARDQRVAVRGWLEISDTDSVTFCKELAGKGVRRIIYTDISRDGTGLGTNLAIYKTLQAISDLSITASGGIVSLQELVELKAIGVDAAILGKSLYSGTISLQNALEIGESP